MIFIFLILLIALVGSIDEKIDSEVYEGLEEGKAVKIIMEVGEQETFVDKLIGREREKIDVPTIIKEKKFLL